MSRRAQPERCPPEPMGIGVRFCFCKPAREHAEIIRSIDAVDSTIVHSRGHAEQSRYRGARPFAHALRIRWMTRLRDKPVAKTFPMRAPLTANSGCVFRRRLHAVASTTFGHRLQ